MNTHQQRVCAFLEAADQHRLTSALPLGLATADDVCFAVVAGRNLLFSAARQMLCEINDTAAYLWQSLECGLGQEAVLNEMVTQGLTRETAGRYFAAATTEWVRLGFLKPVPEHVPSLFGERAPVCQDICVAGVAARIRYAPPLAHNVLPIFQHLDSRSGAPDVTLSVAGDNQEINLFRGGDWLLSCPGEEIVTILKRQILDEVLARASYEIALHAAALVQNGRMLILGGHPGAGKTTLALALVAAGFGFAGDDVALLNSTGQVTAIPFLAAVKAGAWKLVAAHRPDIWDCPVSRRPDGRRVRYLAPRGPVSSTPFPVGWLMLLDRRPGATAALTPVDPATATRWMLRESYARGCQLTTAAFKAIGQVISHAGYYRLTYSQLEDAVELIHQACR